MLWSTTSMSPFHAIKTCQLSLSFHPSITPHTSHTFGSSKKSNLSDYIFPSFYFEGTVACVKCEIRRACRSCLTYLSNAEAGRWLAGSRPDWQDPTANRRAGFLVASGRIDQRQSFRPVRRWELKYCCMKCTVGNRKIIFILIIVIGALGHTI